MPENEVQFNLNDALPEGYVLSREVVFPDADVPITTEIAGKKVIVGKGRVDPITGIFTGNLDADNVHAEILRGQIDGGLGNLNQFLNVSEVELGRMTGHKTTVIDKAEIFNLSLDKQPNAWGEEIHVSPTGHAVVKDATPMPKFHDHD